MILQKRFITGNEGDPVAVDTTLGWVLVGGNANSRVFTNAYNKDVSCNFITSNEELDKRLESFWKIENYGTSPKTVLMSPNEQKALNILKSTSKLKHNRYEVGLLWKKDIPELPFNRNLAVQRFKSLEKKFIKNLFIH